MLPSRRTFNSSTIVLREFADEKGTTWRVWDVNPTLHARPGEVSKRLSIGVPNGWLCFESLGERRRLTPIPDDWDRADDARLAAWCRNATLVPPLDADSESHSLLL